MAVSVADVGGKTVGFAGTDFAFGAEIDWEADSGIDVGDSEVGIVDFGAEIADFGAEIADFEAESVESGAEIVDFGAEIADDFAGKNHHSVDRVDSGRLGCPDNFA